MVTRVMTTMRAASKFFFFLIYFCVCAADSPLNFSIPKCNLTEDSHRRKEWDCKDFNFLRLMRVDTGEAVIVAVEQAGLLQLGDDPEMGWNGACDQFSGGHHLGVYHGNVPQSVEVRFGGGGWGFGHPFGENDRQEFGWAGQPIGVPTVFEIMVMERLPDHLAHELLE